MQQLGSRLDQGLAELDTQIHKQLEQLKQVQSAALHRHVCDAPGG